MIENLVLFRHGKAQRPFEAIDDFTRELTERGQIEARAQAQKLHDYGFSPDVACVSTALRASQTWDCAASLFEDCQTLLTRELYHATADTYLEIAARAANQNSAKSVIIIAHDPGLHDLCRRFLKGSQKDNSRNSLYLGLPTAGAAWFQSSSDNKHGFELLHFFDPQLL